MPHFLNLKKEAKWQNQLEEAITVVHADLVDLVDHEVVDTLQLQGIHQAADERTVPANKKQKN